jgi:hypothetical protein
MTDLEELHARIPGYADYGNEESRHEVDKQIRAYLGEALAVVRDRLKPKGPLGDQLEGLILRCEFSDQRAIRAADHACFVPPLIDHVHALDLALVKVADRIREAKTIDELGAELDEAARLLDERLGVLSETPQS